MGGLYRRKRVKRVRSRQIRLPDCNKCNGKCRHDCLYIIFESNKTSFTKRGEEIEIWRGASVTR